jgi:hypothetical protein
MVIIFFNQSGWNEKKKKMNVKFHVSCFKLGDAMTNMAMSLWHWTARHQNCSSAALNHYLTVDNSINHNFRYVQFNIGLPCNQIMQSTYMLMRGPGEKEILTIYIEIFNSIFDEFELEKFRKTRSEVFIQE